MKTKAGSTLLLAGLLLALGFGTTQVFAAPQTEARGPYCHTAQERTQCYLDCQADGMLGICDTDIGCYCI